MPIPQGDVALLNEAVAQELLRSTIPARLAYVFTDGTPRVVPIWFHWNEKDIVLGTPATAPKVRALRANPNVVLSIDSQTWPYKVLQIRGKARLETVHGVVPEYGAAAERYFGEAQGRAWVEQARTMFPQMIRIAVRPEWVGILDFETRMPSAIAAAMSARTTGA
jgi:PPOX class probable F420-dependent enzyme